jgi:hypothetical protein
MIAFDSIIYIAYVWVKAGWFVFSADEMIESLLKSAYGKEFPTSSDNLKTSVIEYWNRAVKANVVVMLPNGWYALREEFRRIPRVTPPSIRLHIDEKVRHLWSEFLNWLPTLVSTSNSMGKLRELFEKVATPFEGMDLNRIFGFAKYTGLLVPSLNSQGNLSYTCNSILAGPIALVPINVEVFRFDEVTLEFLERYQCNGKVKTAASVRENLRSTRQ